MDLSHLSLKPVQKQIYENSDSQCDKNWFTIWAFF